MTGATLPRSLFVTGTDTGVGKTIVSAILVAGLGATYWKPIQSGLDNITDTDWIRQATGLTDSHFITENYRLTQPLSPHASAAHDGVRIDLDAFHLPEPNVPGHLIIEGAGGVMVPLNEHHFMLDLIRKLGIPAIVVARTGLGTINHTLLSVEQLRRHGIEIFGVVMNGERNESNRDAIEHYGNVRVCAEVEPLSEINQQTLRQAFEVSFGERGGLIALPQKGHWQHSPLHVFVPDSVYMVTGSTLRKAPVFFDEERLELLQTSLLEVTAHYGWQLQAWAIFPNHYHFVAHSSADGTSLSRMIQHLHSRTARLVNQLDHEPGRRVWFQYWDTCITYENSYLARLNYVHHNALKHGVATEAEAYPFCSAAWADSSLTPPTRVAVEPFPYDRVSVPDDF